MKPINTSSEKPLFELKGSVLTIIVLHINDTDADRFYPQLEKKIGQARSFFNNAPVLIDLSTVAEEGQAVLDYKLLINTLRELGVVPVGVRGSTACQAERVLQAGLGLLPAIKTERMVDAYVDQQSPEPESLHEKEQPDSSDKSTSQGPIVVPTKVITLPVRSGQQVFAPQGDLVILSSVNAGAEVLAAGNIHIYGALRGRAMAGINGDATARIFSLQCNPELVAVAGEYLVNELLDEALVNQSVLISLEDSRLKFEVIGSFNPLT
jgi:septum site-determining protein MinC